MSSTKVAVVTGANQGIGRHIATQLAELGYTVYLGARDELRGRETAAELMARGLDVRPVHLDVTAPATIAAAATTVAAEQDHLDALVNNAGISTGFQPPSAVGLEQLRATFETNVFGVVSVTNAFLDLLRASGAPRIVNVSSGLGSISQMASQIPSGAGLNAVAYQASKAALNMVTVSYAKELASAGVKVNAINPGYRATNLGGGAPMPGAGDPAEGAVVAVQLATCGEDGPTGAFVSDNGAQLPW